VSFEIEIKLRLPSDVAKMRRTLSGQGFRVAIARSHEMNVLFESQKNPLGKQGKLIRVRRVGKETILTYKGPSQSTKYKKRQELEVHLSDAAIFEEILKQISYEPAFRYEKFRTEYVQPSSAGRVMLDETPVGNFLELEGRPRWIDHTAKLLGFSAADYITSSYGYLYMLHCRERGIAPKDMLFRSRRKA